MNQYKPMQKEMSEPLISKLVPKPVTEFDSECVAGWTMTFRQRIKILFVGRVQIKYVKMKNNGECFSSDKIPN